MQIIALLFFLQLFLISNSSNLKDKTIYPLRISDGKSIYLVDKGVRHFIPSWDVFVALGFDSDDIKVLLPEIGNSIPLGDPVELSNYIIVTKSETDPQMKSVIDTAKKINPNVNIKKCSDLYMDNSYDVKCLISDIDTEIEEEKNCPGSNSINPRFAWFIRCVAKDLVLQGFQIPAYIDSGSTRERTEILTKQLEDAGFKYIYYNSEYPGNNFPEKIKEKYFKSIPRSGLATEEERNLCERIVHATLPMGNKAAVECAIKGFFILSIIFIMHY
jgi:hypothetical protein